MASSQVRVRFLPGARCFFDKPLQVKVEGLSPHKPVELRSKVVDDRGIAFKASAQYKADELGGVDVSREASLGGSYTGVEPMGLFWSMLPETRHNKILKKSVESPMQVEISAVQGGKVLASEISYREFMPEGMRRIPVTEGRLRGVLFVPPGKGPFPGIVDLYTLGGRLSEPRASLLSSKGFVVLALAYIGYQGLPIKPTHLDLEYFQEAVEYLRGQSEVEGPGIGVISISHSGAVAMSMASFFDGISATVCINACTGNTVIPLHYKDLIFPPLPLAWRRSRLTWSLIHNARNLTPDPENHKASLIPIERATCQFLFAASEGDLNWRSAFFARRAADRLKMHGRDTCSLVVYQKAGHFLEPPHMPFCPSSVHAVSGMPVAFGGEPKAHAEAQLDLWERVQRFFKSHLGNKSSSQESL
uniref:Acyl-CoA thioesterase 21 n=1 Tax=Neogobius melanostomus TaxID=47308 RepID=A0A8C6UU15_9GOBI